MFSTILEDLSDFLLLILGLCGWLIAKNYSKENKELKKEIEDLKNELGENKKERDKIKDQDSENLKSSIIGVITSKE